MNVRNFELRGLAALTLGALLCAGCAQSPQADASKSADAQKSGGVLGGLFASSRLVTIPEGTALYVTLDQSLRSDANVPGDQFDASLAGPVIMDGKAVIPKGARVTGRVVDAKESGRLKGVAHLRLELAEIEVNGKSYDLQTTAITRSGSGHTKRNTAMIGGGTAAGAVIGGLAGGGKGAVIGGAVGAGAGTATAAATGKKEITIPAETQLSFKLTQPVTVQVKN